MFLPIRLISYVIISPTLKFQENLFILKKSKVTLTSEIFMEVEFQQVAYQRLTLTIKLGYGSKRSERLNSCPPESQFFLSRNLKGIFLAWWWYHNLQPHSDNLIGHPEKHHIQMLQEKKGWRDRQRRKSDTFDGIWILTKYLL